MEKNKATHQLNTSRTWPLDLRDSRALTTCRLGRSSSWWRGFFKSLWATRTPSVGFVKEVWGGCGMGGLERVQGEDGKIKSQIKENEEEKTNP